jgi:WS/DGAT/MGAT family acyltransferase
MKQLGILDSAFINLEHTNTPQHIGGFGIYDPSTAPGGFVRFKQVMANVEQRLKKMPVFRTRLVEVPLGLDKPYWVIDDKFDVEFHLRHIALPYPGDWRQLCIQIARLHARPLDMSRPLWECYIIEGLHNIPNLPEGAFAIYTKMHHSLVDGAGSQSFMSALHDLEPNPAPQPHDTTPEVVEEEDLFAASILSSADMMRNAAINNIKSTISLAKGSVKLAGDLFSTLSRMRKDELPAFPIGTPKSRFDNPVGPHRVYDAALFDLEEIKMMRHATGTTINDVAVAIVAGALRKYLIHHDELPDEGLAATMPVNIRARKEITEDNNQVSTIMSVIHTNIEDPIERLLTISESIDDAKRLIDTPLADPLKIAGVFNPWISKSVSNWYVNSKMTSKVPTGSCGVITNVMGPPFPLYSAGAKLVQYHCLGLLTPGGGLFHAIFSMNGTVSISALACRNAMPDPEFYKQCIIDSYEELKAAVSKKYNVKELAAKKKPATAKKAQTVKRAAAKPKKAAAKKAAAKTAKKAAPKKKAAKAPAEAKPAEKEVAMKKKTGAKTASVKPARQDKATAQEKQENQIGLF